MKNASLGFIVGLIFSIFTVLAPKANALEGLYLGGQVGYVDLSGNATKLYNGAIGFGVDLGLKSNPIVDVGLHYLHSSHSGPVGLGSLGLNSFFLSGDLKIFDVSDVILSIGAGPGFYFINAGGVSQSNFGLHVGADGDIRLDDALSVGLGFRYHTMFGDSLKTDFWTLMARIGYVFELM